MKKLLSILLAVAMLAGVCLFAASCQSNSARNSLFTDKFFEGAVKIETDLYMLDCEGDDLQAVIEALKGVELVETDEDVYAAYRYEGTSAMERPIGIPYFWLCVIYEDGHKAVTLISNDKVQVPADQNGLAADKNFIAPGGDVCKRIMDAMGIEGID